jgi:tetratricopeptide (TPR) repeat protein
VVHSRLGEHRQAMSCYQQALALERQWKIPLDRWSLAGLLVGFGHACRAAGDLPGAAGAWQKALQILDELGLPANRPIRAWLQQAVRPSPAR